MKYILCLVVTLATIYTGFGQTEDEKLITATLNNYIEGSSYNNTDLIESAFTEDATLYLVARDTLKRYSPSEYSNFFKKRTKGEYNGRDGKILEIEVINDIATAKAEILITKANNRYIDIFLLRNIKNQGWKIISKTATILND